MHVTSSCLSFFCSLWGRILLLAVIALAVGISLLLRQSAFTKTATGPAYDLLFGVHTFDPDVQTNVVISPYVFQDTLYLQLEKLPPQQGTVSTGVALYRYRSKTGSAELLSLPGPSELPQLKGPQQVVFAATKYLTLDTNDTSPDGYSLAEPNWVDVDPISNALGNIALFALSGKFEQLKKREQAPRLVKGVQSMALKSERPILRNEGDNAFLLGWIVPEGPASASSKR
jgi:hypothetical protein